jgi:hypothetical protein
LQKEVKEMPFGMGPAGWYAWPYMAYGMRFLHPWYEVPYWPPFQPWTKEEEETFLQDQAKILEDQLAQIKKRLGELKKQDKEKK